MDSQVLRWNQDAAEALKQGNLEESLEVLNKAKEALGSASPLLAALTHSNLGSYYNAKGDPVTALASLRRALHFEQKTGHKVNIAATCLRLASAYETLNKFSKGLKYSRRAADTLRGNVTDTATVKILVLAHYESAKLCELMEDYHEAGKHYLKGLEAAEKRLKPFHPIVMALRTGTAKLEEKANSYKFRMGLAPLRPKKPRRQRSLSRPQAKPFSAARRTRRANDSFLTELKANVVHVKASLL